MSGAKAFLTAAILTVLVAPAARAQVPAARAVCVLDFVPLAGAEALYGGVCADTIALELERLGFRLVPNEALRAAFRGDPLDDGAAMAAAEALAADVVVTGFYVMEASSIRIGVKALDVKAGRAALALSDTGKAGVEVFDTIDAIAARVSQRIREAIRPLPASEIVVETVTTTVETVVVDVVVEEGVPMDVTLLSRDEGAAVTAGDTTLGYITGGSLVIRSKLGARLSLVVRKEGFYDSAVALTVSDAKPERTLPALAPVARRELVARYGSDRPFGLEAAYRVYPLPDLLALEAGAGLYYVPFAYPEWLRGGVSPDLEASGGFIELPLKGGVRFMPLSLIDPRGAWKPYAALEASETVLLSVGAGAPRLSLMTAIGVGLGSKWRLGRHSLALEVMLLSPPFLATGGMSVGDSGPTGRLCVAVERLW